MELTLVPGKQYKEPHEGVMSRGPQTFGHISVLYILMNTQIMFFGNVSRTTLL